MLCAAAPLLVLAACKEQPRPQRPTPVVTVKPADKGPLPYIVIANGQVEANRTVAVQALVSGQIMSVGIEEGDEVRQGQTLFQIDPRPFRAELDRVQGTLQRDEATLARARADSARFAALAKDGYITKQQLDQAFAEASALAATVAAGQASLSRARFDLENTTVKAPIAGRTGQMPFRAGALVRASTDQLVTINELRPVLVRFSVPEKDFEEMRRRAGLEKPLAVQVTPGGADSAQRVMGVLTFVDNQVDRATGTVLLKARVANENRLLWPGQFVQVALELSVDQDAVTIPSEAVVTTGTSSFVYLLADGKAARTPVKVGRQFGDVVKIDSGLVGGEPVITEGQTRLRDGAPVQTREAAAAANAGRGGRNGGGRNGGGRNGGQNGGGQNGGGQNGGRNGEGRGPRGGGGATP
ncbi:MAG: efflux RND transporter periplasmic adaptor subunit [Gemmatimonadetes bacterium]|nr:efflux RND transporter periplasmic adaptor subunit [Gemmatimonadota bacterium]